MKTPILFLAVLFIMLGCKTKNEYSIHGSFTGEPTEEWIYLVKLMESNPEVDSAQIVDGTFEIKGMVDFPEVYGLSYHYTKATGICPLFLEPADLKVIIDLEAWNVNSTVSGGIVNDEFNQLEQANKKIMDLYDKRSGARIEKQKKIDEQIENLRTEYQNQNMDYIKNNPASPISIFLLSPIFSAYSLDEQGELLESFTPDVQNTSIYKSLKEEYVEKINPEVSTPSLTFYNELHETDIDLKDAPIIETLINQNPEKHLFIDVWGTWCAPCIEEFPSSRALVNNMQSENIAFVYLCLDSEEDEWKEMLQKEDLKGQHYLINKKQFDRLREEAGTRGGGVPHYLIIDKNGTVVNNHAPKPSSGKVEQLLMIL